MKRFNVKVTFASGRTETFSIIQEVEATAEDVTYALAAHEGSFAFFGKAVNMAQVETYEVTESEMQEE